VKRLSIPAVILAILMTVWPAAGAFADESDTKMDRANAMLDEACKAGNLSAACIRACRRYSKDAFRPWQKACDANISEKEGQPLGSKACNNGKCLYRLACSRDAPHLTCSGSGYRLSQLPDIAGARLLLVDPAGRSSSFIWCGTCGLSESDWASGPHRGARFHAAGSDVIMEIER
jgi:hypothetical protein